jgi:hypothetical protein
MFNKFGTNLQFWWLKACHAHLPGTQGMAEPG